MQAGRPCTITGLAVFSKRLVLFGGETTARIYSSRSYKSCLCKKSLQEASVPEAIVEVVDPMILGSRVQEVCACNCCTSDTPQIPQGDPRLLRRRARTRRRVQAPACNCRPVLHRAARAQHTAAHPELRLLYPEQSCPNVSGAADENPARSSARSISRWTHFSPERMIPASRRPRLHRMQPDSQQIREGSAASGTPLFLMPLNNRFNA